MEVEDELLARHAGLRHGVDERLLEVVEGHHAVLRRLDVALLDHLDQLLEHFCALHGVGVSPAPFRHPETSHVDVFEYKTGRWDGDRLPENIVIINGV